MSITAASKPNVSTTLLIKLACLLPCVLLLLYVHSFAFLKALCIATATALATEYVASQLKKESLFSTHYLDTALNAVLLSICLPISTPIWLMILSAIASVLLAKNLFGGFAKQLFHPAILALAMASLFNSVTFSPIFLTEHGYNALLFFLLMIPGFFLLLKRFIANETPVAFIFTSVALYGNSLMLGSYWPELSISLPAFHEYFSVMILIGIFIVSDSPTAGIHARARAYLGISAALLTYASYLASKNISSFAYALLLCNFIMPWLEQLSVKKLPHET